MSISASFGSDTPDSEADQTTDWDFLKVYEGQFR